jgi:NADH-quinone oxidoreductase subunit C
MSDADAERGVLARVLELFPDEVLERRSERGEASVMLAAGRLDVVMQGLRDDPALDFDRLCDLTAVDHLGREPRFEVVYHLHSLNSRERLRIKVPVPEQHAELHSVTGIWPAANWMEREVWDLYGIRFRGHPDLRRILLYEEFEGHPLRKDYPKARRQPLPLQKEAPEESS